MASDARQEFRRGWRTLFASAVGNGSGLSGLPFYTFGVFVVPLVEAFGWSRGDVSGAASSLIVGTAITAPIIGSMIDRYGVRRVGLASMAALAVGYALLTQLGSSIAMFYAAWLAISLVGGGTTPVVWTRTVGVWFDRGRGFALGLALAGSGLASLFAPVLTNRAIAAWGWQGGYLALAAFILLVAVPLIAIFLQDRPPAAAPSSSARPAMRAVPAGAGASREDPVDALPGLTLEEALRTPAFWKIAIGFFFVSGVVAALIINLVPLLIDRGLDRADAAAIASVMGIAVLGGRIGIGFLLDRLHAPSVARTLLGLCAGGCVLLSLADLPGWAIALAVMSLGLAAAAEVDLVAFLSSRFFGMRAYGKIYGWQLTAFYLGAAIGPFAAGRAYDHFQSYLPVLYFAAGALLFGALVTGTLGRPPVFVPEPVDAQVARAAGGGA
ncbi:MAG: MFS transporter [Steroidobacteraceae bacterium]|jgi:MFS family permease|nr:MFS transporter [Steroidobacteraceae bacterium]